MTKRITKSSHVYEFYWSALHILFTKETNL